MIDGSSFLGHEQAYLQQFVPSRLHLHMLTDKVAVWLERIEEGYRIRTLQVMPFEVPSTLPEPEG